VRQTAAGGPRGKDRQADAGGRREQRRGNRTDGRRHWRYLVILDRESGRHDRPDRVADQSAGAERQRGIRRTGEAGKGFAVVASETLALSLLAAEAAKITRSAAAG